MSDAYVFTVGKADPTGKEPTQGAVLNITADLRTIRETLPHTIWRAATINIHVEDARQVAAALAHLPQGTIDQLLVILLQQRASLLRVTCAFPAAQFPASPSPEFRAAVAHGLDTSTGVDDLPEAIWAALCNPSGDATEGA